MTRLIGTVLRQTRNWFLNEVPRRSPWNFASLCHQYSIANDGNICSNIIDIDSSFSENDKQKILEFKVELYEWSLVGEHVCDPSVITVEQWHHILTLPTVSKRRREFKYIGKIEYLKTKERLKKAEDRISNIEIGNKERAKRLNEKHIIYGLSHTSLYLRLERQNVMRADNARLLRAKMLNTPKIVFDFSYDRYMEKKFACYTAKHFMEFYSSNRDDSLPFDVHICNVDTNTRSIQQLQKLIPIMDNTCPVDVHRECYSELYPHEKLLYLSPYSQNVLKDYDPEDVLVIPAVVEYGTQGPISMIRARQLGIRTAWLPISRYMECGMHARKLPLCTVGDILRKFKNTRDWDKALERIPRRIRKLQRQERPLLNECISRTTDTERMYQLPGIIRKLPGKMVAASDKPNPQNDSTNCDRNPFKDVV